MDLKLELDARSATGKANRRLRREGIVPGVVYGTGTASIPVQVDAKIFETLYRRAGRTSVVTLSVPDADRSKSAIIKSVQRNPLSGRTLHVDFLLVDLRHEMEVEVPLVFTGEAPAAEETGGTLVTQLEQVRVRALPNDIPHEITVDVSSLVDLDAAIHVSDLAEGGAFTILNDGEELVAKVLPPRIEPEPELVAPEIEGELPEGEAPVEGEAPAEGEAPGEGPSAAPEEEGAS